MFQTLKQFVALALVLVLPALAAACPNCKDGMANEPNGANIINGYFWSICFMMSMPYLIFTCLGLYLYWEVRKARRAKALAAAVAEVPEVAASEEVRLEETAVS